MKKFFAIASTAALMALCGSVYAAAGSGKEDAGGAEKVERKGPLAELPSEPGPHMAKIKALATASR